MRRHDQPATLQGSELIDHRTAGPPGAAHAEEAAHAASGSDLPTPPGGEPDADEDERDPEAPAPIGEPPVPIPVPPPSAPPPMHVA